jgi:hypothetical protein
LTQLNAIIYLIKEKKPTIWPRAQMLKNMENKGFNARKGFGYVEVLGVEVLGVEVMGVEVLGVEV